MNFEFTRIARRQSQYSIGQCARRKRERRYKIMKELIRSVLFAPVKENGPKL